MDQQAPDAHQVTRLLHAWRTGQDDARQELISLVYPQLRSLAAHYMSGEAPNHTLSATGLVNEAYIKILGSDVAWDDRVHFFALAARIMRHILVDHAKSKHREKRGGSAAKISLDDVVVVSAEPEDQLIYLNEALDELASLDRRKADMVELIYFGGLSQLEAASVLGISEATVQRELRLAKSWLYRFLSRAGYKS
jgi:RNA polymerase sigma factor (TIGR02999 family)